jgi:hypothetical protein
MSQVLSGRQREHLALISFLQVASQNLHHDCTINQEKGCGQAENNR